MTFTNNAAGKMGLGSACGYCVDLTIDVGKLSVKGQIVNFTFYGSSKVSVVSSFYFVDGARD